MRSLACLALLSGCVRRPLADALPAAIQYQIALVGQFSFEGGDDDPVLAGIGGGEVALDLLVTVSPWERHPDGSEDHQVAFDRARGAVTWGERTTPLGPAGLEGRALLVRSFSDGELLSVGWADHVLGDGRDGEVFDVLLPVLSPFPPALREGQSAPRRARWPLRAADGSGITSVLQSVWTHAGMASVDGVSAWHLRYEGAWSTSGVDRGAEPALRIEGEGTGAGEVTYRESDQALLTHEFVWERILVVQNRSKDDNGPQVRQRQRFTGTLRRVTP